MLSSRDKLTLLAILDFDRRARGVTLYPSLERIARMTGYAYSTVRLAVEPSTVPVSTCTEAGFCR